MSILTNFHIQLAGEATLPKLVFLHGLMGSGQNWRQVVNHFSDRFQVLTFDQRGHGRSFHPESGYRPEDFAEDLKAIIDELGWNRIYLVGHSMGGRNAMSFSFRYPQMVEALVIEDIGPDASRAAIDSIRELLDSVPVPFAHRAEARKFFLNDFMKIHKNRAHAKTISQFFYTNIIETPSGEADWRFYRKGILEAAVAGRSSDRWYEFERITAPTLIIRGEDSIEFPQNVFDQMLARNSHCQGVVIEGSGHWVHFDHPERFVQELQSFFQQIKGH